MKVSDKKRPRRCWQHPGARPTEKGGYCGQHQSSAPHAHRFCRQAALRGDSELTGIEYRVLSSAFAGEEKNLALDVVETAVAEKPEATPEDW
jgi:hypothetical protein